MCRPCKCQVQPDPLHGLGPQKAFSAGLRRLIGSSYCLPFGCCFCKSHPKLVNSPRQKSKSRVQQALASFRRSKPLPPVREPTPDASCCYLCLCSGSAGRSHAGAVLPTWGLWGHVPPAPRGQLLHIGVCWVGPRCSRTAGPRLLGSAGKRVLVLRRLLWCPLKQVSPSVSLCSEGNCGGISF